MANDKPWENLDTHAHGRTLRLRLGVSTDDELLEKLRMSRMVDLSACIYTHEVGLALAAYFGVLGRATMVEQLYLHSNPINDHAVIGVANCEFPMLRKLHLHESGVGDAGAAAIADALRSRAWPMLEDCNLSKCRVGDDGAMALALALRHGVHGLRELSLNSNQIGDLGAIALFNSFFGAGKLSPAGGHCDTFITYADRQPARLPFLTTVRLARNYISEQGLAALARSLGDVENRMRHCPRLTVFEVIEQRSSSDDETKLDDASLAVAAWEEAKEAPPSQTMRPLCWTAPSDARYRFGADGGAAPTLANVLQSAVTMAPASLPPHLQPHPPRENQNAASKSGMLPAEVIALIRRDGREMPPPDPNAPSSELKPPPLDNIEWAMDMARRASLSLESRIAEAAEADLAEMIASRRRSTSPPR